MAKILMISQQETELSMLEIRIKNALQGTDIVHTTALDTAVKMATRHEPDVILIENFGAGKNAEVFERLKVDNNTAAIPLIFMSDAETGGSDRITARKAGIDAFLTRPFDDTELEALVTFVLKSKGNGKEKSNHTSILNSNLLTEKHFNTKSLNENGQLYKYLFESASDFVFFHEFNSFDSAGKFLRISEVSCERLGYSKEEMLQLGPIDLTPAAEKESLREWAENLEQKGELVFEQNLLTKNGEKIPVELHSRFLEVDGKSMVLTIGRDITERKKSVELLKSSEEKFHKLFKSSPIPQSSWVYKEGKFVLNEVNFAGLKVTQGNAGDFIGLTAEEVYRGRKDIVERFYYCSNQRRNLVYETDYLTRDAASKRIIFTFSYVTDKLILVHTEDITDRKQFQEKLIESERRFRSLISEMDQGLALHKAIFDEKGKMVNYHFLDFNKSFEKLTGLKREETVGKTLLEVLPDVEQYWLQEYEKVVKTGHPSHFEKFSKEIGKYFDVTAYRNHENQFATVISDITESKKALKELKLHNERLEVLTKILKYDSENTSELLDFTLEQAVNLTESIIGYIFFYNELTRKFTLNTWSEKATKDCRVKSKQKVYDLESTGCWGEAVRQRKPFYINDYSKANKYKKGIPEGHVLLKKFLSVPVITDNEIKAVIGVANKTDDYSEKDIKQLSLLMDAVWKVLERKQHNEELLAAKEKAEESDKLKSSFLANMSHEIRTPMNGILGFTEMLRDPLIAEKEKVNYIGIIEKSAQRMLNTINELIDISRIESNLVEINPKTVNINEVIDGLHKFFRTEAEGKGLQLLTQKSLPDEKAFIITDDEKFHAAFSNLIKNALKYTEKGYVKFGYQKVDDSIQFFVDDTGIGIENDRIEAVFERFVQADLSMSRPYEGVGLGLSIAKAYIELLGGKIWVESEKGKGSKFLFEISYTEDSQELIEKGDIRQDPDDLLTDLTILVAEDDQVGRIYLQQLLEGKCKKVFYARNGKEAVNIYRENEHIDLVLMDIKMPVMDGYTATIKIRALDSDAVIIAQTAYALSGDREKAIAAGCDDYLTKPLAKETLLSTIQKYFSK